MTMITPSYLGETIEYSSLHACRSTLEDPTYMLRGDLNSSRREFLKALHREPGNPMILNNLKLLDGSSQFIKRSPDAL